MTKEERKDLARKIMQEEEKGISPEVQSLGQLVLSEVFRLENEGILRKQMPLKLFCRLMRRFWLLWHLFWDRKNLRERWRHIRKKK